MDIVLNFKWIAIIFLTVLTALFFERILLFVLNNKKDRCWIKKDEIVSSKQIEKDINAKNHDALITNKLIDKYHLVTEEFLNKSTKEQNIENNQEIHLLNKEIAELREEIERCKKNK